MELEDVKLPSAWYPPAIVEYNYVTNIWIDNSSVKLIIDASRWWRDTDTNIETQTVQGQLPRSDPVANQNILLGDHKLLHNQEASQ